MPYLHRSREVAKKAGADVFLGKHCRYGHNGVRLVSNGKCKYCSQKQEAERQKRRNEARANMLKSCPDSFQRRVFVLGNPDRVTQR